MREKSAWFRGLNPIVHSWFKILVMCVFLGILIVWGIDGLSMSSFHNDYIVLKLDSGPLPFKDFDFRTPTIEFQPKFKNLKQIDDLNLTNQVLANTHENPDLISQNVSSVSPNSSADSSKNLTEIGIGIEVGRNTSSSSTPRILPWISSDLEGNYSSHLLANWLAQGGEPCKDSRTVDVKVPSLDGNGSVELVAGELHEFVFQAVDEAGQPHCLGGDYFELDLSGEKWKSRPPVKDLGNGSYAFSLQVHQDFAGDYNLTIILLFRHFEGLKFSTSKLAFDRVLRLVPIKFVESASSRLPRIGLCSWSDYTKDVWSGRWTRHGMKENCKISHDGRFRCLNPGFPCKNPWCEGPLGALESNGWVYSAHCSFKLYSSQEAWGCLNGRWIFWWGDSNHCDTIRNMLHFILGVSASEIPVVPRLFDMNITNPRNASQQVRFTSIFNGHWNHTANYQGLNSLANEGYREKLKDYFSREIVPDTIIMNSGLHDGIYWSSIRSFIQGADFAARFWAEVVDGVRRRGLRPPEVIYRTTVATGGYARSLAFNPHKMEVFNGVVVDKLRHHGLLSRVIDDFDMTYPWHFDNRCNDGVHYGRAPLKAKWRDGRVGHEYFVDLMLGHVLLNALCVRPI